MPKNVIFTRQSLWRAELGPELNSGSPISESIYINPESSSGSETLKRVQGDSIVFPQQILIMANDNYVEAIHESTLHSRKSIRLKGYDYSQTGAYFVTICAHNRELLFGMVENDKSQLNKFGQIVKKEWLITAKIRQNIELDEYAIMPNHFHGILLITDNSRGTEHRAPTVEQFGKPVSGSLPTIIRSFKSTVTKQINQLRNTPGSSVWQRNYYEHIIRNEDGLNRIREYIINNPIQWQFDRENPHHIIDKTYHTNWGKIEELIYGKIKK